MTKVLRLKIKPFPSGAAQVEVWDTAPEPDVLQTTVTGFVSVAEADEWCKGWFLLSEAGALTENHKAGVSKFLELNA